MILIKKILSKLKAHTDSRCKKNIIHDIRTIFDPKISDIAFSDTSKIIPLIKKYCETNFMIQVDRVIFSIIVDAEELRPNSDHISNSDVLLRLISDRGKYIALVIFCTEIQNNCD